MTQGEAVFQAVCEVLGGEPDTKVELSEKELKQVEELVFQGFMTGACTHSKNPTPQQSPDQQAALRKYIPGLVNNWIRKDGRLNGGTKYVAKNPGSRSGSGDESVKAMKTLLSMTTDPEAKAAIQLEIGKRVSELKPKVELDISKLPESIRHLAAKK